MNRKYEVEPFCCELSLMEDVLSTLSYIYNLRDGEFSSVAVLCNEDVAERILKLLCSLSFGDETELNIEHIDFDIANYDGEYAVIVSMEDLGYLDITLSVEKAQYQDGSYKYYDLHYVYTDEECSEELIMHQSECDSEMDIFSIGEI
jgi:hypothetical protein